MKILFKILFFCIPAINISTFSVSSWAQTGGATSVADLIRAAFDHHPSLKSMQSRQQASAAGIEAARWQFWPVPSVSFENASTSQADVSYRGDSSVTFVRLQQPVFTGGRLTGNLARAEAQMAVSDAEYADARQQLALRVLQAWSENLIAERKLQAYRVSLRVHERLYGLVQRRESEGVSAVADVALASSRISALQSELQAITAQRDTALARLRLLTGLPITPEAVSSPVLSLPERSVALADLLDAARQHHPGLARSRALAETALAEIQVAKAALSPEVFVRLERQHGNFFQASQPTVNRAFVGLSTSVGGGLSSLSNIQGATARHQSALDEQEVQRLTLEDQIQSDFALAQTAEARRAGMEAARQAAAEVLMSYERQFLAGRKQWLDVMNAAREQAQSDVQLADAVGAQQLANWRLALLTRGVDAVLQQTVANPQSPRGLS